MRKVYGIQLLRQLHLANFVYYNEEFDEIYAWFNGPIIKILNYLGEEVGTATIYNSEANREYTPDEIIPMHDVQTSVDTIVSELYNE